MTLDKKNIDIYIDFFVLPYCFVTRQGIVEFISI